MTTHSGCSCHGKTANPTEVLKNEHRVIERVLDALERFAADERIDAATFHRAIDFLRNFADGCHHAKEENVLFPRLESAGVPRAGGPIGCMLDEHTQGRALIRAMADNVDAAARGDATASKTVRTAAAQYVQLLRNHIWKEDNVLFAMADRVLGEPQQKEMLSNFDEAEHAQGEGKHERYVRIAEELHGQAFGCRKAGAVS